MYYTLLVLFILNCSSSEKKDAYAPIKKTSFESEEKTASAGSNSNLSLKEKKDIQRKMIIYNATITIKASSVKLKIEQIQTQVEKSQGYVVSMNSYGNMIIRIPYENFKSFLKLLKDSTNEYKEEISSQDVTEEFHDTEIQLDNSKKVRDVYLGILKTAKNLEEILKVQTELNKISESIDRLEGRIRYLSNKSNFSTVTINIYSENNAIEVKAKQFKPGILGYPFYYLYKGIGLAFDGLIWLFIQEKPENDT